MSRALHVELRPCPIRPSSTCLRARIPRVGNPSNRRVSLTTGRMNRASVRLTQSGSRSRSGRATVTRRPPSPVVIRDIARKDPETTVHCVVCAVNIGPAAKGGRVDCCRDCRKLMLSMTELAGLIPATHVCVARPQRGRCDVLEHRKLVSIAVALARRSARGQQLDVDTLIERAHSKSTEQSTRKLQADSAKR